MGTKYLGTCWETMQDATGKVALTKLHLYWISGERRFALTEEAARAAVADALAGGR
jgi:hypothetical protein